MTNIYHMLYLLWRLDISIWHIHHANDPHTTAEKEREYVK
jgi:phosphoribosyl 1,2-cyclic phosphodiesterase